MNDSRLGCTVRVRLWVRDGPVNSDLLVAVLSNGAARRSRSSNIHFVASLDTTVTTVFELGDGIVDQILHISIADEGVAIERDGIE